MPAGAVRRVAFHADDFGMNAAVNQGILQAFRDGLLTSTSLLSNAPAALEACREWPRLISDLASLSLPSVAPRRETGDPLTAFDLGIHLNLTQGRPLTAAGYPAEFLDEQGNFPGIGATFQKLRDANSRQLAAVRAELQAQVEWARDQGLKLTHLNGHQYVELIPRISAMIPELLRTYAIPVVRVARETRLVRTVLWQGRWTAFGLALVKRFYANRFRQRMAAERIPKPDRFFGTSHAGLIDLPTLNQFLRSASRAGFTEIGVHPAKVDTDPLPSSDPWFDPLHNDRPRELEWLCSSALRDLLISRDLMPARLQSLAVPSHR